eukprot:3612696-Pleurochrysis_carterae.AAC.3
MACARQNLSTRRGLTRARSFSCWFGRWSKRGRLSERVRSARRSRLWQGAGAVQTIKGAQDSSSEKWQRGGGEMQSRCCGDAVEMQLR